jgi:hypothetical protein
MSRRLLEWRPEGMAYAEFKKWLLDLLTVGPSGRARIIDRTDELGGRQ